MKQINYSKVLFKQIIHASKEPWISEADASGRRAEKTLEEKNRRGFEKKEDGETHRSVGRGAVDSAVSHPGLT